MLRFVNSGNPACVSACVFKNGVEPGAKNFIDVIELRSPNNCERCKNI